MSKNITATAQVIPFRKAELLLVEHDGQPFVPMKPVVEGMGLDWKSQHVKITAGRFSTCVVEITMQLPGDTQRRAVTCLPLRKLTGWLMSIHPNKVKPELSDGIIAYQNECDDVLWAYWSEGRAVRNDSRTIETVLSTTIGADGFRCLSAVVDGKVSFLPAPVRRQAKAKLWSQLRAAFGVRRSEDIPANQIDAARTFVAAYNVREGEWLPGKDAPEKPLDIEFTVEKWISENPLLAKQQLHGEGSLLVTHDMLFGMDVLSPTLRLIGNLSRAGHNVDACRLEVMSMRHHLETLSRALGDIRRQCGSTLQQGVRFKVGQGIAA